MGPVGEVVYAGGGSLEGVVNAFMPALSGRLVDCAATKGLDDAEVWIFFDITSDLLSALDLRPKFLIDPNNDFEVEEGMLRRACE